MRCMFQIGRVGQRPPWIEVRDVSPQPGDRIERAGTSYTVESVDWWFGGIDDQLALTDVLVVLRTSR
jgi:hypothetical protein